ncbi:MAG: hypothetical protein MI739_03960 [Bacteroidales bacterium]|nr:hypothetical protein [Bacteroidales bacterium]
MILQVKLTLLIFLGLGMHPIHVSVTNMEYFPNTKELEFSTKIFKDDLQLLFIHLDRLDIDFNNNDSILRYQNRIKSYFEKKINISINNIDQKYSYKKFKTNKEAIWLTFSIKIRDTVRSIKIKNTLLLDLYLDQKNLFILKLNDSQKAYQFNIKNTTHTFNAN